MSAKEFWSIYDKEFWTMVEPDNIEKATHGSKTYSYKPKDETIEIRWYTEVFDDNSVKEHVYLFYYKDANNNIYKYTTNGAFKLKVSYTNTNGGSMQIETVNLGESGIFTTTALAYCIKTLLDIINKKGFFAPRGLVYIASTDVCNIFNSCNRALRMNGFAVQKINNEKKMTDKKLREWLENIIPENADDEQLNEFIYTNKKQTFLKQQYRATESLKDLKKLGPHLKL